MDEHDHTVLLAATRTGTRSNTQPREVPLGVTMAIYVGTALLQPTLTDEIRYLGGAGNIGWPPTLLATLANTSAMASLMVIGFKGVCNTLWTTHTAVEATRDGEGRTRPSASAATPRAGERRLNFASIRTVLIGACIDFSSGALLTTGLLMLGGGIFVVIYSSTTVWTAMWATCTGQSLSLSRWAGVLLVTSGMALSASGNLAEVEGDVAATMQVVIGCAVLVAGTMLHAAMFVYAEVVATRAGMDLLVLCASMGTVETAVLVLWNVLLLVWRGPALYVDPGTQADGTKLVLLYGALVVANAVHAWSFFTMLARVGAVSSAVMKGLQMASPRRIGPPRPSSRRLSMQRQPCQPLHLTEAPLHPTPPAATLTVSAGAGLQLLGDLLLSLSGDAVLLVDQGDRGGHSLRRLTGVRMRHGARRHSQPDRSFYTTPSRTHCIPCAHKGPRAPLVSVRCAARGRSRCAISLRSIVFSIQSSRIPLQLNICNRLRLIIH